jgi:hypothetical protein
MTGIKSDKGKLRWSLLPWAELEQVVEVLEFGAKKYSADNWKHVESLDDRYFDALMRHLMAYRRGERIDPESGLHHLAHAACNILFMMWGDSNVKDSEL